MGICIAALSQSPIPRLLDNLMDTFTLGGFQIIHVRDLHWHQAEMRQNESFEKLIDCRAQVRSL
jgi:hypothetical protein